MSETNGATKLYVRSPGKRARYREARPEELPDFDRMKDPRIESAKASLPPSVIDSVVEMQRQIFRISSGILIQSDMAYRRDKSLQRMMLHDPDVMGPLLLRRYAVALLDWDIVPEDAGDQVQKDQADQLKTSMEQNFRRYHDFVSHLESACWFGPSAAQVLYRDKVGADGRRIVYPASWLAIHPDTLAFDELGRLGLRVGYRFGERIDPDGGGGTEMRDPPGYADKVPSYDGWVHMLHEDERKSIALHVWNPTGADYEIAQEARHPYAGMGLRSICWFAWLMKQTALRLWMVWMERYSLGIRIGRYPDGDAEAKGDMETILKNLIGDVSIAVPQDVDFPEKFKIEVLEAGGGAGRQKIFADLIQGYLAGQLKQMILGQTATTEATTEGLGTGVSDRHAETMHNIVKFDARSLEDSLTYELVHRLNMMNFGDTPHRPRFEFSIEDVDSHEFFEGVEKYVNLGGTVSQRQARNRLGIEEPQPDEPILQSQQTMGGGGGFGGGGDPFGDLFGGGEDDGPKVQARRFRRAMRG